MSADLRDFLTQLDQSGELVGIDAAVDLHHELAGVLSLLEGGPAVRFDAVAGAAMPVVGNVVNSRERIARALGVELDGISGALLGSIASPLLPTMREEGRSQEVVRVSDLTTLPIPTFFEKESGAYITAGVILVRDVLTGQRNLSFARFKVLGSNYAMLGVSPNHHLGQMAKRAAEAGQDLPIAVAIGVHPAIMLAACLYLGFGDDELACAGALLGAPVDVVRAIESEILVPADAEIVLEGVVKTTDLIEEGLVSEFHGRYHDYGAGLGVEFSTMTHRADPLFQVIVPGLHSEHLLLGAVSIAAGMRAHLQALVPNIRDIAVPENGAGRTAMVVSVDDIQPGQAEQIIRAGLTTVKLVKQVIVVDGDVDPWNADAVEWARLSHARPERDFVVLPHERTDRSDPLSHDLYLGKLGVDATAKPGERVEGWDFAQVPDDAKRRAAAVLAEAGLFPAQSRLVSGIMPARGER